MALYYIEGDAAKAKDVEVKEYIIEFAWNNDLLKDSILVEMVEYVVIEIKPRTDNIND